MKNSIQQVTGEFDYDALDEETRVLVLSCTGEIRSQMRKSTEGVIEAGRRLVEVKAALKHGQFGAWLQAEFGYTERSAENLMNVYRKSETVSDLGKNIDKFAPTVLYLLAAPSTPKRVIRNAVKRVKAGETVTKTEVQAMKRAYALAESSSGRQYSPAATHAVPKQKSAGQKPRQDSYRARINALLDRASAQMEQKTYEWLADQMGVSS